MAKSVQREVQDGVNQIVQILKSKEDEQIVASWRDLRNKIDSLLLSSNVLTSNEARLKCLKLDELDHNARREYVHTYWGPLYLEKIDPLLHQLDSLERQILSDEQ